MKIRSNIEFLMLVLMVPFLAWFMESLQCYLIPNFSTKNLTINGQISTHFKPGHSFGPSTENFRNKIEMNQQKIHTKHPNIIFQDLLDQIFRILNSTAEIPWIMLKMVPLKRASKVLYLTWFSWDFMFSTLLHITLSLTNHKRFSNSSLALLLFEVGYVVNDMQQTNEHCL